MTEAWRDVVGYDGAYQVSDLGNVRSMPRHGCREMRAVSQTLSARGYWRTGLNKNGKRKMHLTHVLVLEAFVGPRPHPDAQCRHLDDNRANPKLSNLAWGTVRENNDDKIRAKSNYGERNAGAKLTEADASEVKRRLNAGESGASLAEEFGVSKSTISRISSGRLWAQTLPAISKTLS